MPTAPAARCLLWPLLVTTLLTTGCPIPNYVTHYDAEMKPLANCRVEGGIEECLESVDGGTTLTGSLSLDERGDSTRVFFRQEVLVGSSDSDTVHAEKTRETVYVILQAEPATLRSQLQALRCVGLGCPRQHVDHSFPRGGIDPTI